MDKQPQTQAQERKPVYFSIATIVSIAACVGCGYLFLFIYERDLFFAGEKFALFILAASIALPPLVVNTVTILPKYETTTIADSVYHRMVSVYLYSGAVIVCVIYGITILLGYFFELSTGTGVIVFLAVEILFGLIMRWASKSGVK